MPVKTLMTLYIMVSRIWLSSIISFTEVANAIITTAGSIATADRLVRVMVKEAGVPITEAVRMITQTPAGIMKLNKGTLESGKDADIVVFDEDINIKDVFGMGNKIR